MPFANYESMSECKQAHSDKQDPGAYCAAIHYEATGEWPSSKSFESEDEHLEACLIAADTMGYEPDDDFLLDLQAKHLGDDVRPPGDADSESESESKTKSESKSKTKSERGPSPDTGSGDGGSSMDSDESDPDNPGGLADRVVRTFDRLFEFGDGDEDGGR